LETLATDPDELVGICDWVTKKWLLDSFASSEGLDWEDPKDRSWLQSQDLEYHNIDPDEGLYLLLEAQGDTSRLVDDEGVTRAVVHPPAATRAYFRGRVLEKFGAAIRSLNWDSIELETEGKVVVVDLRSCVDEETLSYYNHTIAESSTVEELLCGLSSGNVVR